MSDKLKPAKLWLIQESLRDLPPESSPEATTVEYRVSAAENCIYPKLGGYLLEAEVADLIGRGVSVYINTP